MSENLSNHQIIKYALEGSPDPTLAFSADGVVLYLNSAAKQLFPELEEAASTVQELSDLLKPGDQLISQFSKAAKKGRAFVTEAMPLNSKSRYRRRFIPVLNQQEILGVYLYLRSDEFANEGQSKLLETNSLNIMLENALDHGSRDLEARKIALFIIQIRNLREIQAMYGSQIIEVIMEHITMTIRSTLRENDMIFQLSEDRILTMITRYAWRSDLLIIAQRIEDQIAVPFHTKDTVLHLLPSIGIAMFPDDGADRETLVRNAETALVKAVSDQLPYLMYNTRIHNEAMDRLIIRGDLNRAIKDRELRLQYMPICDANGSIRGLEALVRWQHPSRGLLLPEQFLPIAIHSRIIGTITRWVVYRVIEHLQNELQSFPHYITINISSSDLNDSFFLDSLKSAMGKSVDPRRLRVEITETEIMSNFRENLRRIRAIQAAGVEVMVDDFGTGHSSLTYLNELPVKYLKIDRSFLNNVLGNPDNVEFLRLTIEMGHVKHKEVVLEGIETRSHWEALKTCGADLFQGFYLGQPMGIDEVLSFIREKTSR